MLAHPLLAALLLPLLPLLLAQPAQGAGRRYSTPLDEAYPWAVPSEEAVQAYRYACKHQRNLNRAAAAFDAGPVDLVLYGDSLVDTAGVSAYRQPCALQPPADGMDAAEGAARAFKRAFVGLSTLNMGLSADTTGGLMWRLLDGEAPEALNATAALVLIGTNDLQPGSQSVKAAGATAAQIEEVVDYLLGSDPDLRVLLLGLLPRSNAYFQDLDWPSAYTPAVQRVNARLAKYAEGAAPRVKFANCGRQFVGSAGIIGHAMPDGLHPSGAGWTRMSRCIKPALAELVPELAPKLGLAPPSAVVAPAGNSTTTAAAGNNATNVPAANAKDAISILG